MGTKWKKRLARLLALSLAAGMLSVNSFADETVPPAAEPPDLYIYESAWDGVSFNSDGEKVASRWYFHGANGGRKWESENTVEFWWVDQDDPTTRIYSRDGIKTGLFHVLRTDGTEENHPAYCCDFVFTAVGETKYKLINLEESTYFDPDEAAHIRGIFQHGYWLDWDGDETAALAAAEAKVNAWLAENHSGESIPAVESLTADQAMTATQLAIWHFANTRGYGGYDYDIQPDDEGAVGDNIRYFRDYLIGQEAEPATRKDLVFSSNGYFVTSQAVFSELSNGEAGITYDLTLRVQLAADVDGGDDLTLSAKLADRAADVYPLTGDNALEADGSGYYTIRFSNATAEEAALGIQLTLSGHQALDGVYFFEAMPSNPNSNSSARTTSQNFVGKSTGTTPVYVEKAIPVELGTQEVSLTKLNVDSAPLDGVTFDLFARKNGVEHPVKQGLVTGANGRISVAGLPEGYVYFFRETSPLPGYRWDPDQEYTVSGPDGITVVNEYDPTTLTGSLTLDGTKYLDGTPSVQPFQFILTEVTDPEHPIQLDRAANGTDGAFHFAPIEYSAPGTYSYTVQEEANTAYQCDGQIYRVEAAVSADYAAGVLRVDSRILSGDHQDMDRMTFYNYSPVNDGGDGDEPDTPSDQTPPDETTPEETPTEEPTPDIPPVTEPETPPTEPSAPVEPTMPAEPTQPAEPLPAPPAAEVPATGDAMLLWLAAAAIAGLGLVLLKVRSRKSN